MENENELDYNTLEVDKADETVYYNDKLHKYWTRKSHQSCISVTTLIHNYTVFDEDFWSSYKAIESLADPETFLGIKSLLLDSKKFNEGYLDMTNISKEDFLERKQEVLDEWAEKREASCLRGSAIHKNLELGHLAGDTKELQYFGLGGVFNTNTTNQIAPGVQAVYPELLLSRISPDGELRIAGQADLIIIDGFDVYVLDYKSNREIKMKSYYDRKTKRSQMMVYPLNNLEDTNFWHYTLQLSTYAWMIEKIDPRFKIKSLTLIHYDHDGNVTTYDCEYRKKDVERMLAHYKQKLKHDEFKKSRQKIVF